MPTPSLCSLNSPSASPKETVCRSPELTTGTTKEHSRAACWQPGAGWGSWGKRAGSASHFPRLAHDRYLINAWLWMAREPKHDDGSTTHSPHRVYPPHFYTLIFRNKTPRELKETHSRFIWRPACAVHSPCWNQLSASIRDAVSEDADGEEEMRRGEAEGYSPQHAWPSWVPASTRPHRSDSHREASRKDGEQGWRRSHTRMLLEMQATAARRVTLPWAVGRGSTGPQPC